MGDVVLDRPHSDSRSTQNPLCGDWEGLQDSTTSASSRLHIVQSSDGALTAWMDRALLVGDQRYGELLKIVSADPSRFVLELVSAIAPQYRFTGVLSDGGLTLRGSWNGLHAHSNFRRIQ
jgi:hypothetical protein